MFAKYIVSAVVLAALAVPCAAQMSHHIAVPPEEIKAASPQCSLGAVYDDGIFTNFYSLGDGDPGDATMVMKFDLPPGTTSLDQVCACFTRLSAASPSSMSFEVVVYNDNGAGGQPGTFLGSFNATASSIPIVGGSQFAGLTNVKVVLKVTDTKTGAINIYTNPQGTAFKPILDSSAFATCP